ncbi:50S ribosomal protein L5 [bacterium]|nr:50S ribosomal protein L5 [bacterium]MCI0566038.1 50S ribosomal protein L5 [bacterium]
METVKQKENKSFSALKESFGYKNTLQGSRIQKIIVSVGTGSLKDKKKEEIIIDRLQKITGQRPHATAAKKSIATFKVREGDTVGYAVTLRGSRMYAFFDRFIHIAVPRTRDFRGFSRDSVDRMGNLTLGIKEHTIFPETSDEETKDVFGLAMTVTTTAKTKEEGTAFFEHLGLPFKKK